MDVDGKIPLGEPWVEWLDTQVAACDLMLVLVGPSWVSEFEVRSGARDFVRIEIESALARKIPVVPVFLGDTPVPLAATLPPSIQPLLGRQATRLQRASFDADTKSLINGVQSSLYRGRIKVDAKHVHGAPNDWFMPGNGKTEWFKDCDVGPEMVVVPAGTFTMGSPTNEPDRRWEEEEQVRVTIPTPFAVGKFAVTFNEWDVCVADGGCNGYKPSPRAPSRQEQLFLEEANMSNVVPISSPTKCRPPAIWPVARPAVQRPRPETARKPRAIVGIPRFRSLTLDNTFRHFFRIELQSSVIVIGEYIALTTSDGT